MKRCGESIYGSTYTSLQDLSWGRATRKGSRIFLHIFDWPIDGKLSISTFPDSIHTASILAGESLTFTQTGDRLEISLPPQAPHPDISVVVLEI